MNIVVCIKQVVDTGDIKWTKNNTIDREGVESVVNPCDMLALETALKIKDDMPGVKITVISMGPKQAVSALKTAIAMGCDDAVLLCDKKFSGADTVATSRTISAAIKKLFPDFDLIICGQYAADGDTAQTGPSIAQKLDIEQITYVAELKPLSRCLENTLTAIRKADDAIEVLETNLPALICVSECPFAPRNIKIDGYVKAQDFNVRVVDAEELELSSDEIGLKGSPTWVSKAFRAVNNRQNEIILDVSVGDAVNIISDFVDAVKESSNE